MRLTRSDSAIIRVYVTCIGSPEHIGCSEHELCDRSSLADGLRIAKEHARKTGHGSHVSVETEFIISPYAKPKP